MNTKRKNALSVLITARKLITPRKKWIKGASARDARGAVTYGSSANAVQFCSVGALRHAAGRAECARINARTVLQSEMRGDIIGFNDAPRRTHEEILAAFDRAIAKLRRGRRRAA